MSEQQPAKSHPKPPTKVAEERYLDLWEENVQLITANNPPVKKQTKDD